MGSRGHAEVAKPENLNYLQPLHDEMFNVHMFIFICNFFTTLYRPLQLYLQFYFCFLVSKVLACSGAFQGQLVGGFPISAAIVTAPIQ